MNTRFMMMLLSICGVVFAGRAVADVQPTAFATLQDREGNNVGRVSLRETADGLLVTINMLGTLPGPYAVHLHSVGRCERPDFESAGDHFNPDQRQHGFLASNGPHAGDLPNLHVPGDRGLTVETLAPRMKLSSGSPQTLLDDDGAAVVLHAGRDDYVSQPGGDSGLRLACGVVHRGPAAAW